MSSMRSHRTALVGVIVALIASSPVHAGPLPEGGPKCATEHPPEGSTQQPDDGVLRVGDFNVLHGLTEQAPGYPSSSTLNVRTSMAAQQISDASLDIVGMQEVSVVEGPTADLNHPLDVAQTLAARTAAVTGVPWHWCWFLANPHFPGEPDVQPGGGGPLSELEAQYVSQFTGAPYAKFKEGLAILSRHPIVDSAGIHLPGRVPIEAPLCAFGPEPSSDPAALLGSLPDTLPDAPLCAATVLFETRAALWARVQSSAGYVDLTTTHLAHDITAGSDVSSLEQAAVALAFAEERSSSSATGDAQHRFFTCDCNAQPEDDVPVIGFIESQGYTNTLPGSCAGDGVCTAGGDVIVTAGASRAMHERLDYLFAYRDTCTIGAGLVVNTPLAPGAQAGGVTNPTAGYLWPSDHIGVAASLAAC